MEKEKIYLTDITLHVREFRQTINYSKVAHKGRIYSPLPKDYAKNFKTKSKEFSMSIALPKDLMARVNAGEVELMMPNDGLYIFAGRDVYEKIEQIDRKEKKKRFKNLSTWHADEKGV